MSGNWNKHVSSNFGKGGSGWRRGRNYNMELRYAALPCGFLKKEYKCEHFWRRIMTTTIKKSGKIDGKKKKCGFEIIIRKK
jgi:hypothetical protein